MKAFVIEEYRGGFLVRFVEGKLQLEDAAVVPDLKDAFREADSFFMRPEEKPNSPSPEKPLYLP